MHPWLGVAQQSGCSALALSGVAAPETLINHGLSQVFAVPAGYCDLLRVPEFVVYAQLNRLVDAGFEQRIMFGSDQMVWPPND